MGKKGKGCNLRFLRVAPALGMLSWLETARANSGARRNKFHLPARRGLQTIFMPQAASGGQRVFYASSGGVDGVGVGVFLSILRFVP